MTRESAVKVVPSGVRDQPLLLAGAERTDPVYWTVDRLIQRALKDLKRCDPRLVELHYGWAFGEFRAYLNVRLISSAHYRSALQELGAIRESRLSRKGEESKAALARRPGKKVLDRTNTGEQS